MPSVGQKIPEPGIRPHCRISKNHKLPVNHKHGISKNSDDLKYRNRHQTEHKYNYAKKQTES